MQHSTLKTWWPVMALLIVLSAASCKKDKDSSPSLQGKYRMAYRPDSDTAAAYYIFNADNTVTFLDEDNEGGRQIRHGVYELKGNSATVYFGYMNLYTVSYSGDTVKLLSDPARGYTYSGNIILVKDNNAPLDETWIPSVTFTRKIVSQNLQLSSLAYHNGSIWASSNYENRLRSYNITTGVENTPVSTADTYYGLESTGTDLWGITESGPGILRKLNATTGAIMFTAPAPAGQIYALAYDGSNLVCWSGNTNRMQIYNIATNTFTTGPTFDLNFQEFAFKGGYLYAIAYNYIYKLDPATLRVVKSYRFAETEGAIGLLTDGSSFYTYVRNSVNEPGYFAQFNLN